VLEISEDWAHNAHEPLFCRSWHCSLSDVKPLKTGWFLWFITKSVGFKNLLVFSKIEVSTVAKRFSVSFIGLSTGFHRFWKWVLFWFCNLWWYVDDVEYCWYGNHFQTNLSGVVSFRWNPAGDLIGEWTDQEQPPWTGSLKVFPLGFLGWLGAFSKIILQRMTIVEE
jgi:hypothetical protein